MRTRAVVTRNLSHDLPYLLDPELTAFVDLKEAFNIGVDPYEPEQEPPKDLDYGPYPSGPMNTWPEAPANFRRLMYEYRKCCMDFSRALLRLIALSLDLDESYFDHMARFPMAGLRPLYYPSQQVKDDVGIGAHADYSC